MRRFAVSQNVDAANVLVAMMDMKIMSIIVQMVLTV